MGRNMFLYYFFLSLVVINYAESNFTSDCGKKEKVISYLDIAVEMINKVKSNMPPFLDIEKNFTKGPIDCADILRMEQRKSGVYKIWPMNRLTENEPVNVYCDMDTDGGGWTVIQRRGNYGNSEDYFFREWKSYKDGFGNIEKEFWLGNDNIFALTNQRQYSVRFDLQGEEKKSYALYEVFWIDDDFNNYTLHAETYSGNAGDSLKTHNEQNFSTKDVDGDTIRSNYATSYKCGWWYSSDAKSNLNGLDRRGHSHEAGVFWYTWGERYSLESSEIKIRPKNFIVSKDFINTPQ